MHLRLAEAKQKKPLAVVVGLGLHDGGVGSTVWLATHGFRVRVLDTSDRKRLRESLQKIRDRLLSSVSNITFILDRPHQQSDLHDARLVVLNPDVAQDAPIRQWAHQAGVQQRVGDTSLFIERCPVPIIGVTGTRGKTTVTSLIGAMLKRSGFATIVAGNLRRSPLWALDALKRHASANPAHTKVVLELSSWQCEGLKDIQKSPHIAVVTNIMPDHLNRYASLRDYATAKTMILRYQRTNDIAVLNYDDRRVRSFARLVRGNLCWFSRNGLLPRGTQGAYEDGGALWLQQGRRRTRISDTSRLKLLGDHQRFNALAAIVATAAAGASLSAIRATLATFEPLSGRLEKVRTVNGVTWYNDTAATTPDATIAALETLHPLHASLILIAGGMDKQLSYTHLVPCIHRHCRALILLPGTTSTILQRLIKRRCSQTPMFTAVTLKRAVIRAHRIARQGDAVILSPAAASFNQFRHSVERGERFINAVKLLPTSLIEKPRSISNRRGRRISPRGLFERAKRASSAARKTATAASKA